jgi:hypothetical protein
MSLLLFGDCLLRQPLFIVLSEQLPAALRVLWPTPGADRLMNEAIFLATFPGFTASQIERMEAVIHEFAAL